MEGTKLHQQKIKSFHLVIFGGNMESIESPYRQAVGTLASQTSRS